MQSISKRFVNVKEIANHLSLSEHTIRSWVKKGKMPFSKLGRAVRFDMQKLEPWIKAKENPYTNRNLA